MKHHPNPLSVLSCCRLTTELIRKLDKSPIHPLLRSYTLIFDSSRLEKQFHVAVKILHPRQNGQPVSPEELMDFFKRDLITLLERPESRQAAMIYEWLRSHDLDLTD